jgi:serine/threonine-protein phosphatase PGAM5
VGTRTLVLLRHGQYEAEGVGSLTSLGRDQARASARYLKTLPIDAVWASTLVRARETAEIVAGALGKTYRTTRILREGLYSKVEGYPVPASERQEDRERADRAFAQFFRKSRRDRTELIVCHGNLIRYLVCRALRAPVPTWLRMTTSHCGLTRILVRGTGAVRVVSYNETSHLPPDLVT